MSNALAIAGVSAVLKDLLNNGLIDHDIGALVNAPVTVTVLPPDRVKTGDDNEQPQLNLFLYQVTPNIGWSNVGLPSRDDQGARLTNRPLALDLHYLLTAYGKKDFDGEILLGYAMQLLHETPVLSRDAIRTALAATSPVTGDLLPPATSPLLASDLADQVEQIKISPHNLNMEELSKLWTALQGHYRPTAAYHVSVVLIESRQATRAALPVLTRGKPDPVTHRDAGVAVQANMMPPLPRLESLEAPQQNAAIRMGEMLTINGFNLDDASPTVQFIRVRSKNPLLLSVATASATKWTISIPPDPPAPPVASDSPLNPDNWEIGIYRVTGVVGSGATQIMTNELPLALAPRIVKINPPTKAGGVVTLTLQCSPKVWQEQEVSLIVGDQEIVADAITAAKTDTLTFKSSDLPTGKQWVRLRVDGIDSILIDRSTTPPSFDTAQRIDIP